MQAQVEVLEIDSAVDPAANASTRHRELSGYVIAGAAYIALGFVAKQVFAWWSYGAIFAVLTIWGLPALWKRLRL